jgi:hypothetical protein
MRGAIERSTSPAIATATAESLSHIYREQHETVGFRSTQLDRKGASSSMIRELGGPVVEVGAQIISIARAD